MKCGTHGLLSRASLVQLVCGYEHGRLTVTDVVTISAITWHILKVKLVFQIYGLL